MLKLLQKFPLRHSRFEVPNLRHYKRWVFVATISPYQRLLRSYVGITIITKVEILRGRIDDVLKAETGANLLKAQELLFRTEQLLNDLAIILIDRSASIEFDRLRAESKFRRIGRADLLIASITLAHRATLVTRNLRHFKQIPGLRLENWVDR